jgi:PAS domain S-box-containing protein
VKPVSEDSALQDPERLAALRATGLLDAPPEESFDRFTRLARRLLGASFAQLSLVDDHRQFAMSVAGPEGDEVPRDVPNTGAICPRVVATGRSLAAGDLREHPELHDSPAVTDHGVVAYAGVPVRLRRGAVIGSFCVFGEEARVWSDDDMEVLDDLGAAVAAEIDLRAQLDERHRVETELAETRDQLRGILDFSPALIYLKDLEGRYLLVNRNFAEALDRTEEEIVGHLDVDVLDAPSLEVVHAEERQVLATGALVSELRTLDTDEGRQHWRTLKFPLRDEAGEIYALCGIASDETARVRDMDALAESQDRLRRAFDDAPIGMAMLRSGAFVRVNDALCEMLGYSAEELCSMRMADVAHPVDLARDRADVDGMLRGEINTMLADTRLIAADGSEREVLLSATALGTHGGAPDEVSLQMQDVTDRRRARRELTLRHEAARALFDANDIVVAAPDVLAAMAELIGASQSTLWLDSGDGTLRRIAAWSRRGIPPEQRSPGDAALRQRTMSEFQVLWRQDSVCVPVQTQRQAPPLGVAEFVRDNGPPREDALEHLLALTGGIALFLERRRHEHELARARDEALDASRMKSSFLANMSHEIRTPMNGVIGMTDLLLGSGLDEEQRRWATTLRTSGRALLTIIDDILDFSKVEAGKLELERVQFSLHEVVDATCDILVEQARNKGLVLEAFVERRVPDQMWGDPGRLQQVLTNIMSNAVKFTDRGSVTLRVNVVDATCDILGEQAQAKGLSLEAFVERRVPPRMWGDPGRLQQVLTNIVANAVKFTERGGVTLRVSVRPDVRSVLTHRRCCASRSLPSSRSLIPMTPFIGVRISWLMLARKLDFIFEASRASSRALASSASWRRRSMMSAIAPDSAMTCCSASSPGGGPPRTNSTTPSGRAPREVCTGRQTDSPSITIRPSSMARMRTAASPPGCSAGDRPARLQAAIRCTEPPSSEASHSVPSDASSRSVIGARASGATVTMSSCSKSARDASWRRLSSRRARRRSVTSWICSEIASGRPSSSRPIPVELSMTSRSLPSLARNRTRAPGSPVCGLVMLARGSSATPSWTTAPIE